MLEMILYLQQEILDHYGSETSYLGPKIWDLLPKTLKIWKISTFSNHMLSSFGRLRTAHFVCAKFI